MFILVVQSIWHAIIGAMIFQKTPDNRVTPSMEYVRLDHYVFFVIITVFVTIHIILIAWLFFVPLKYRKNMKKSGLEYERALSTKKGKRKRIVDEIHSERSALFSHIPMNT